MACEGENAAGRSIQTLTTMKYLLEFENGYKAFHLPQEFPFVPVVGDTIRNGGNDVVILRREFVFKDVDGWYGILTVKEA